MQELEKILEEIENAKNEYPKACFPWYVNGMKAAEEIICKHMNDGWIPVEEKVPEEAGTYIINALTGERNIVTFAKWQNRYKRFDMTGARTYWKIIAWCPLPEPYRPERRI